jgi:hypothetical protein
MLTVPLEFLITQWQGMTHGVVDFAQTLLNGRGQTALLLGDAPPPCALGRQH